MRREMFDQELKQFCEVIKIPLAELSIPQFPACMPEKLKAPSNNFICQCIIYDYQEKEILYTQCMAQSTTDHTFKVAANIGLLRPSDRKWERQYDLMFAVLNEDGIVLAWQLTKGTAFENVKDLLTNLKQIFDQRKRGQP